MGKFGLKGLKEEKGYFTKFVETTAKLQYVGSKISYLFGLHDVCPVDGTYDGEPCDHAAVGPPRPDDSSYDCGDRIQGRDRTERGINFWRSMIELYGKDLQTNHRLQTIPFVGHDGNAIVNSEYSIPIIFDDKPKEVVNSENANEYTTMRISVCLILIAST